MAGSIYLTSSLLALGGEMAEATAKWILARSNRPGNLQRKLARLEDAGAISISVDSMLDQRLLRLTAGSHRRLLGCADPEEAWRRRWDGVWRLVVFDIPESSRALRTRLRRRLRESRFGRLQNSVWISPHPVDEFRQELGELELVPESLTYFAARPVGGEGTPALVNTAWDYDRLAKDYGSYRKILDSRPRQGIGTTAQWFCWMGKESRAWHRIARRDPFLPFELQPAGYAGQAAWAERREAMAEFARFIAAQAKAKGIGTRRAGTVDAT